MRRFGKLFAVVTLCTAVLPVAVTGTVLTAFLTLPLPAVLPEEHAFAESQISRVYDIDGNEIGVFREFEQSIPVNPEDIPPHLKQAVIASEDRNFYGHSGVDLRGSLRALITDIRGGRIEQGGSTITQQYVKNAIVGSDRTIVRKVREAIYATQLDRQYDKELILFKYLSSIYLGEGAYGVGAASETYFRKPVSQINLSEAAMLAGLIPAPSFYEPRGNPQGAEEKRKLVLSQMLDLGFIDQAQHDDAVAHPVWVLAQGAPPGPATVIHPPVKEFRQYPYFIDYVEKYLKEKYGAPRVDKGGLRIQTTIDPALQSAAEKTVADALRGTAPPLEMALVTVEPPTGFVKALVGGRDFYTSNVNLALGGCPNRDVYSKFEVQVTPTCWDDSTAVIDGGGGGRQTGSAFKPVTLAAAFEKGIPPTKVYAAPGSYTIPGCRGRHCTIGNNEGAGGGSQSIRTATHQSTNTVYAQIAREVGVDKVAEMAKKLGIASALYAPGFHGSPTGGLSYTLGVLDTAPIEMAAAYAVFANRGVRHAPTPIVKVVDAAGNVLEDNTKREGDRVLDEVVADNVTDVLRGVISGGTGSRANIGRPAAGKTGSSQFNANAWFVGYTPTLSTAVWMGKTTGQGPDHALLGVRGVRRVYGGTIPAATWKAFMSVALKDVPATDFNEPAPIRSITDALRRRERADFDPGPRRAITDTDDGGTFEHEPPKPRAQPPVSTTTTAPSAGPEDPGDDDSGIFFP